MPRLIPYLFGTVLFLFVVGVPLAYGLRHQSQYRNLRLVREGVLYRSGQLSLGALKSVLNDRGIRTVITLRDSDTPGEPPPDLAEQRYCEAEEINYVRISPRNWWAPGGAVPAAEGVRVFLSVMDDPANHPVLIHCYAGIHRTGAFCAVYRMEFDHWTNAEAVAEMKALGYRDLGDEWDLLSFLERYRPRWQK
jgi:protein tyrosine/serine phosphatase